MNNEIHTYGSSPLRNQHDYGEKTASKYNITYFSANANKIIEKLQDFQYGCAYTDGKIITNLNDIDKEDGANIYIQSPLEFWNNKIGMCHDASILIDVLLTKENIEHSCCFIYSDEPPYYPTHSFVIALSNDDKYRIIDIFAVNSGVYENAFNNINEAIKWRFNQWIKTDNNGKNKIMVSANDGGKYSQIIAEQFFKSVKFTEEK
jgi:hypothetical protein